MAKIIKETKHNWTHYVIECESCCAHVGTGHKNLKLCAKCAHSKTYAEVFNEN